MSTRVKWAACFALTAIGLLLVPAPVASAQDFLSPYPPRLADDDRWSFGATVRYTILDGDEIGSTLTGAGTADFDYTEVLESELGWSVEAAYNYNDDATEVRWGPWVGVSGDYFSGHSDSDGGVRITARDMGTYTFLAGLKVQNEDRGAEGGLFWEVRAGIGGAHTSNVDATVRTTAGALIARGDLIDGTLSGANMVGGRIGYEEDEWAIYAGFGWQYVWDVDNGNLGADPDGYHLFPIELGFIYRF